jgi:very-short-patch-repair endonuclease
VQRLVKIIDDSAIPTDGYEDGDRPPDRQVPSEMEEIYFPLPANDEQREIAQKLATRQGVLVQGPPGTGKSHTIANLVCHLLATGQRILITSHTSRALKALLDKFEQEIDLKEIAGLCVILLGDDLNALQSLEDSVRGITDQYKAWNPEKNRQRIRELEKKLDEARRSEASCLSELRSLREAETYQHPPRFGGYSGTAQDIAVQLRKDQPGYGWLPANPGEDEDPPLSDEEAAELLKLLREIDREQEQELSKAWVDPESLISPAEFSQLVRKETELRARFANVEPLRSHPSYPALRSAPLEQRTALISGISELLRDFHALAQHIHPWVREAAIHMLTDRDRAWRDLLNMTRDTLASIQNHASKASRWKISGLGERDRSVVKNHAVSLLQHLEYGGKLGFGPFRPRVVKESFYLIKEVRIDGDLCDDAHILRRLIDWIEVCERLDRLHARWSTHAQLPAGDFSVQVEEYLDLCEPLEKALELHKKMLNLREIVTSIPGLREPIWHDPEDLRVLTKVAEAVHIEEEVNEGGKAFTQLEERLTPLSHDRNVHVSVLHMRDAVRSRDDEKYSQAHRVLSGLKRTRVAVERRTALLQRLRPASPSLTSDLTTNCSDPVWDERMTRFSAAWNWARADQWLRRFNDPQAQERLMHSLESYRRRIREHIRDLSAAKAWGYCLTRLTEHQRQHLEAWSRAMQRIGKGTGKYASLHRKAAREHMEECRSAIPAWIMPIYRVAETIRPGIDTFDVVIVDEASQSGPEALFLQYLAKKIVVVGDDKQISPDFVGITREDVELLRQRHLCDIPHSDALGVDNSFFDQAAIRFGGRIRLREHFRCMPEIIQFSNSLCYRSEPLIPLRQYGAGRLTPVVATKHVPHGYMKGHSPRVVNPPEADAIVDLIKQCCEDPRYDDKSMGVISLLGEDQARLIEKRLLETIGPEEMEKRNLVCGDAYAFQGTERDVMFLSLVSATREGRRIGTLASSKDEKRFNVAASRARDQMWLFHTATLNDLSPSCLRYRLLEYCQNPSVEPASIGSVQIQELRRLARIADRSRDVPPPPFESWFEVDVFLIIGERGYRVIPQFEIAGYRIDLVIEGLQGRLAVECDGDIWHGGERYAEDMTRQRMLERCGWVFWRVRGSTFYRDPDLALKELWTALENLKIHPNSNSNGCSSPPSPAGKSLTSGHRQERPPITARPATQTNTQAKGTQLPLEKPTTGSLFQDERASANQDNLTAPPSSQSIDIEEMESLEHESAHSFLAPYCKWTPRPLPDPRSASMEEVVSGLVEIIKAEGPIICHRAYSLYAKAAGFQRVGRQIRSFLNRAVRKAVRQGLVDERNEHGTRDQLNQIVRPKGGPPVVPRTRGDRAFEEIPPAEIAALMKWLVEQDPGLHGDNLIRAVLQNYGFRRTTANIRDSLILIMTQHLSG